MANYSAKAFIFTLLGAFTWEGLKIMGEMLMVFFIFLTEIFTKANGKKTIRMAKGDFILLKKGNFSNFILEILLILCIKNLEGIVIKISIILDIGQMINMKGMGKFIQLMGN